MYVRIWFDVVSLGTKATLLRFRPGPLAQLVTVAVTTKDALVLDDSFDRSSYSSAPGLVSEADWHVLQVHVDTAHNHVDVWLDGLPISKLSRSASLGSAAISTVELGESAQARTYDIAFDDVVIDTAFIGPSIHGLSTPSGAVGRPVVITGSGLTSVNTVTFGGANATLFRVNSDRRVTVRVPKDGANGPLVVGTSDGDMAAAPESFTVTLSHIVLIEMENKAYDQIVGSTSAPYINQCLLGNVDCPDPATSFPTESATSMYGAQHHSEPDYMDITSGNNPKNEGLPCSSYNIQHCPDPNVNIVDQLEQAGLSWASFAQDYPGPEGACNDTYRVLAPNSTAPIYTVGHVPFMYYNDIRADAARCANLFGATSVPDMGDASGLASLEAAATTGALPTFSFVTPNEFTDMHQKCHLAICPPGAPDQVAQGDEFLRYWVPLIMHHLGPYDELIITWDESASTDTTTCCDGPGGAQPIIVGGHIPTFVVLGAGVTPTSLDAPMDTLSVLAGIENVLSLPGNIAAPAPGQEHFLDQPYATCGCTNPLPL
jgi:hypothetical protein